MQTQYSSDIDTDLYFQPNTERKNRGSHDYWYRLYKATKNVYFNSFFPRAIMQWNNLSSDIVSVDSMDVLGLSTFLIFVNKLLVLQLWYF